ncbi:MAG: hypothetical protein ACOX7F_05350 [Eubacteriales bacterium]|jgi:hypothetical protein
MDMEVLAQRLLQREPALETRETALERLEEAAQRIRNYTHLDEVPDELEGVLLSMAQRLEEEGVEAIYEGDTKVQYAHTEPEALYYSQLNRFRKRCGP